MDLPAYLETITDERRRADARLLIDVIGEVTGEPPARWGQCLYLKRVEDADQAVLREVVERSYRAAASGS
jgi:hypothetical protein